MAKTKIGGQAVMEGVMMRGESSMALAVRDEAGVIRVEATRIPPKKAINKIPFLRGIANLINSLVSGTSTLMRSAEVAGEAEVTESDDKSLKGALVFSVFLGVALALALFVILPTYIPEWINGIFSTTLPPFAKIAVQEVAKIIIIVVYFVSVSKMEDIKRVFMYHGAEHKTISCFENELELTVENVMKSDKHHDRCGTSFIVYVFVLSLIVIMGASFVFQAVGFTAYFDKGWIRMLINLAFIPVVASISYEMLMGLAKSSCKIFNPLKNLGKLMQRITTAEPDEKMCEVAITAFKKVLEMDLDKNIPEERFPEPVPYEEFLAFVKQKLAENSLDVANAEWMARGLLQLKLNADLKKVMVSVCYFAKVEKAISNILEGMPFAYACSSAPFFEYYFYVDDKVLIPRMETELLAEQVIKANSKKVLDLCCGSGCIGLTVAKKTSARVVLADISKDALKRAKFNANRLGVKGAKYVRSNMFEKIGGKYDMIVCNPPYIATDVIQTLDKSVKDYEPHVALDGGMDGLDFYRVLAKYAHKHLKAGGKLYMEIGFDQGETAKAYFVDKYDVEVKQDYSGNDRMILAIKRK